MYLHTLPTTGAVSFGDALVAPPGSSLGRELARATELRAALRAVLKERKHGDDGERADWLSVVKAVDDYLPYLFSIFNCVQTDDLLVQAEPEFSWRSTLSSSFLREPPRITLRGLHFELCSVLLLSATALSNLAVATVASLGAYERDVSLSTDVRKAHDDRLRLSADRLCTAAGIFEYLSLSLIPQWEATAGRIAGRAPDMTREVTMALSKLALADAETLAIRKLLSPFLSRATDTVTPGPPLPKTHPSASLLAKLTLNVSTLYAGAHALALTAGKKAGSRTGGTSDLADAVPSPAGSSKRGGGTAEKMLDRLKDSTSSADGDIASGLLRYLSTSRDLARARAHKWLGIDAGEAGRYGDAIALLGMSRETLEELGAGGGARKALKERGNRENKSALLARREEEVQIVEHWLKSYKKLNDTVGFQPLTKASDMQSRIPAGRAALAARRYEPPEPAFGPGSAGYLSEGMRRLGVDDAAQGATGSEALPADVAGVLRPDAKGQRQDYAGAGAYY